MTEDIFNKIYEVTKFIETVPKNGYNKHGGYYYALADDVLREVRKACLKARLLIIPKMLEELEFDGVSRKFLFDFTLVNLDDITDTLTIPWQGWANAKMAGDKAPNIAIIQAQKYLNRALFNIPTGDESDDIPNTSVTLVSGATLKRLSDVGKQYHKRFTETAWEDSSEKWAKWASEEVVTDIKKLTEDQAVCIIEEMNKKLAEK